MENRPLTMSATLVSELERLANTLTGEQAPETEVPLAAIGEKIAGCLGVKTDEVAILGVSRRWKHLHFLMPLALKNMGSIPLSSTSALAARTVRDNRAEINNTFVGARHASVFEGVKAETISGEAIQKIISAPISNGGRVVGVMQVSRKGGTPAAAGPDFTAAELGQVLALCRPLGRLVEHLAGE